MEEEQGAGKLSSEESWNRDIPDESCKNWQRIVNLLTEIIKTPVGLVMRVHESEIEVFVTSDSQGNPYKKSEMADLNTGRYCETVMSQQCRLLVPNALKDPDWDQNPDIELGMISYLGYPLVWPDGKVFGTLCVLDNKENAYSEIHQSLVEEFSYSINSSLKTIADSRILDVTCRKKAEEERLESLARFSGFAEASQYGMGMADLEGRIVYANSTLAKMLGEKSAEACLGKHFPSSYYPESSAKKLQEEVMPALLANGSWHGELELMAADGHSMPTNENYFVIKDASGNPRYFAGILTDISQSKLAEKALQESEEKYRIFFENSSDGMIMIQGNTIVDSNAAASQMLGYQKAEELIGLHPWELSPEYQQDGRKSKEKAEEMIASALKNGAHGFEWEHSKKENGDIIPVEVSLTAIPSKGKPLLHVTWRDISVRREAEQALRQSERKLQAIFDHHYQLTGLVDVDGKIIAANRTALSIAKTDESEVIGKYLWDGPWWEESQRQQIKEASKRAVEGDFVRFETTYRGSEGEQKIMDFSLSTVKDDSGKVIYLVPEGRDITDIRHTEDLLRENEKRLRILSDNLPGGMTYQVDIGEEGEMRQFNYVSAGVEYLHELKVEDVLADAGLLYSRF